MYKMGDQFVSGGRILLLARTINYKDEKLLHFQLIDVSNGNRHTDRVITVNREVDNVLFLTKEDMHYLLEDDFLDRSDASRFLGGHIKGPFWHED